MHARDHYLHHGPDRYGEADLLALVLGAGGRDPLSTAAALLWRFGDLHSIANSQPQELQAVSGVGEAGAVRIHAALQLGRRAACRQKRGATVCSPDAALRHLGPPLRGLDREELHGLYLDRRRRPLALRPLTRGSDAFTVVDPRQVFRPAIALGASAVIIAHHHPSGDPTPSAQDVEVTERVGRAGRVLGVMLLDHLIVSADGFVSLATEGRLPAWGPPLPTWTA